MFFLSFLLSKRVPKQSALHSSPGPSLTSSETSSVPFHLGFLRGSRIAFGFANPNLAQPSFPTACQCSLHFTPSAALTESPTRFTCQTQRTPKLCQVFLQQHELFFAFKIPQVNLQKRKQFTTSATFVFTSAGMCSSSCVM